MPIRWAQWFEEAGEVAGLPRDHCARYRSQREQVAAVWANNRRTFLSTDEHVEALVQSLVEADELAQQSEDEEDSARTLPQAVDCVRRTSCTLGVGLLLRRVCRGPR
mmetsp:Transcript_104322/g.184773  ORF Transcript_104322/g.184773 Transcript_104322/m.184773 type:complete len:107 (-) Transcript_104322:82-402(-)